MMHTLSEANRASASATDGNVPARLAGATAGVRTGKSTLMQSSRTSTDRRWMNQTERTMTTGSGLEELFQVVERAKREWESAIDSLPDLVCVIDSDGYILRANRIVEEWQLGRVDTVAGLSLHDLVHPACADADCYFRALAGPLQQLAINGQSLDHETFDPVLKRYVRVHVQPVLGRTQVSNLSLVVTICDITERRRVELERERLIVDLEAYAHTVAHDLKNPVSLIVGYAELLENDLNTASFELIRDCARLIVRSGHKLNVIIDELLLFAEVQDAEIQLRPLDMGAIVNEALERLRDQIVDVNAQISLPEAWPVALGHRQWIEEVWVNYVSNALKYTRRPVRIELGATVLPTGQVRFCVRDNGDGVPPEGLEQIFAPFTRLSQMRARGHGLGLSIVRRIVERLHGQVGVENNQAPAEGCTFYFVLPGAEG